MPAATIPAPPLDEGVAFAREPIHDDRGALAGYELLGVQSTSPDADGSRVALAVLADVGLAGATGGAPAFLNVTPTMLELLDPLPFGPEGIVLELQPSSAPADGTAARARRLRDRGYTLALDGHGPGDELDALAPLVQIVKLPAGEVTGERLRHLAERTGGARIAACGVDDHETLAACLAHGVVLVQGAVHVRPRPLEGRSVPTGDLSQLRAVAAAGGDPVDLEELAAAIGRDLGLSVRLLRYLNSAAFGLRSPVSSVRQAVVTLGPKTVRQWAMLVTLAGPGAAGGPLLTRALARARLAEALARRLGARDVDAYFTAGLFSVLDALLDAPMADLLAELPLAPDLHAALLDGAGGKGRVLAVVRHAEVGGWDRAAVLLPAVPTHALAALHTAALRWADTTVRALGA